MKHLAATISGKMFEVPSIRVELIPVEKFKRASWNPPTRTDSRRLRSLAEQMMDKGQQSPVHVNKSFMLIDGHRRLTVAKQLGIAALFAIVHDNCESRKDFKQLYAQLNESQRKMSMAEMMYNYLMAGKDAVPVRVLPKIQSLERMIGHEKFANYARANRSCTEAVRSAGRAALLAGQPGDEALMGQLIIWQVDTGRQGQLRQALDAKASWQEIKHAMDTNTDLRTRSA